MHYILNFLRLTFHFLSIILHLTPRHDWKSMLTMICHLNRAANAPASDYYLGVVDPARLPTIATALVERSCMFVATVDGQVLVVTFVRAGNFARIMIILWVCSQFDACWCVDVMLRS